MNRYTQLTPASFNPLSVEEIMMVPMAKQARHDQTQLAAMQEGMFENPYLDTDSDIVEQEMTGIKQGLADIEEELATKGVSNGITRKMLGLKRKKMEFLSPAGIGGKAASNYSAYQQNVKDIMDNDATPQEKMMQIRAAKAQYEATGGVAEGANYNPYLGFNTYDIPEFLMKVGVNINPEVIERESGWKRTADGTMWTNGTTKTTKLPQKVIQSVMMKAAAGNPELVSYLQEKSRVTPGFDAGSELMRAVMGAADQFIQNEYSKQTDMKFTPEWMASVGSGSGASSFNTFKGDVAGVNDVYSDIDVLIEEKGASFIPNSPFGAFNWLKSKMNEIPEGKQEIWKKQGRALVGKNFNLNNKEHRQRLHQYLNEVKHLAGTTDVTVQDVSAVNVGIIGEGVSKDETKWKAAVNKQFNTPGTKFMANGKYYTSRKQLLDDLGLDPREVKEVNQPLGIVHWDNMLFTNLGKGEQQWAGDFAQPIATSIIDGKGNPITVYMSRKDSDMGGNVKRREGYRHLNQVFGDMRTMPEIPVNIEVATDEGNRVANVVLTNKGFAIDLGGGYELRTREEIENAVLNRFDP